MSPVFLYSSGWTAFETSFSRIRCSKSAGNDPKIFKCIHQTRYNSIGRLRSNRFEKGSRGMMYKFWAPMVVWRFNPHRLRGSGRCGWLYRVCFLRSLQTWRRWRVETCAANLVKTPSTFQDEFEPKQSLIMSRLRRWLDTFRKERGVKKAYHRIKIFSIFTSELRYRIVHTVT